MSIHVQRIRISAGLTLTLEEIYANKIIVRSSGHSAGLFGIMAGRSEETSGEIQRGDRVMLRSPKRD